MPTLKDVATRWIEDDPDPITRAEGQDIVNAEDENLLREHFGQRLNFGTAGLRAPLGPGPNRMNCAMVRRVTSAVGAYMEATLDNAHERGVVVGFDGRHGSRPFAQETAAVLTARGFTVYLYDEVTPTPQAAHATRYLGCAGGIVVTASHNPPEDNGYKVFWANGAQIVPPQDQGISQAIDAIERTSDVHVMASEVARSAGRLRDVPEAVLSSYLDEVSALRVYNGPTDLKVIYTAMHGVGRKLIETVLHAHGYTGLVSVKEQGDPDPDFPTVNFPNPEEPGAMDLSLQYGKSEDADLIIANDPDADRLAVAVKVGEGGYRQLTGNQVGVLLAHELLIHGPKVPGRMVATTIVSSAMLKVIADHVGVEYAETLTGFKWLAQHSIAVQERGGRFVMGFEEALGYSVGHVVRDKDGVSAALLFCDLAARCKEEGITVLDRLAEVYGVYGVYASKQHALKLPGEEGRIRIETIMEDLRKTLPEQVGDRSVAVIRDLKSREATTLSTGEKRLLDLPSSNVLAFDLADGGRILARPSGTEPKIKFYFEVRDEMQSGEALADAEARAESRLASLEQDFLMAIGI